MLAKLMEKTGVQSTPVPGPGSPVVSGASGGAETAETESVINGWFSQADNDPCFPRGLSRKQRIIGFITLLLLGSLFISLALVFLPMVLLKARKFAILYTMGSLCLLGSFSMLWGPANHLRHLLSGERVIFSAVYLGTMMATLYAAMSMKSWLFSIIFTCIQILSLIWYLISYIPGGQTGMKVFGRLFYTVAHKTVKTTLPV